MPKGFSVVGDPAAKKPQLYCKTLKIWVVTIYIVTAAT